MAEMVAARELTLQDGDQLEPEGEAAPDAHPVVRRAERERIDIDGFGGLVAWERLTGERHPGVDFLEIQYSPGASSARNYLRHQGREYGLVLEGELTVNLAFEEYVLGPGDSIAFDSSTPHRLSNQASGPVRAVWVVTDRTPGAPPPAG
jgi:quercetin dioxygenase-like cupin family protein